MFGDGADAVVRVVCIVVAMLGLVLLLGAMIGFEQRRRGAVPAVIVGALLVVGSVGGVIMESLPS